MACFGRPTEFFCHVVLLDESEFPVEIQKYTNGQDVLEKVFEHLNLLERDYFGLRYIDRASQSRWLDPMKPVIKQLQAGPPYLLYLCVKFYAADPCKLHEELTRYLFFLQVKRDIFQGRLPCSQNMLAELSAYALQSELGDFDYKNNTVGYVSEFRYVPKQSEELEEKITDCHKRLIAIVPSVAEFMYLDKAKWLEMYGVDLHLVKGEDLVEYFVALKPAGVVVYNNKTPVGTYLWPKITKIDFKGKKFYLNVKGKEGREYTYVFYLSNKSACKHLWKCCVEHHTFFSGRTQKEALEEGNRIRRPSPLVKRKPSKRYERRNSQSNERGQSNVTVHSTSQVQIRTLTQTGQESNTRTKLGEVITPDGRVMKSNGKPTHMSGDVYESCPSSRGPALPWEEPAQSQAGLYTPAPDSPRSVRSGGSTGKPRRRSPKFPRPHRRPGQSSGSETDTARKRSRSAYYSDDDAGRRRRHHKRSHHHRHAYSADSGSDGDNLPSNGRRRKQRGPEQLVKLGDSAPYHWNECGQDRYSYRHDHPSSDKDARSDGSARHMHRRSTYSEPSRRSPASEMIPALNIIQPRVAITRVAKEDQHRYHRHHKHSHHGYPSSESGQSAFSAPPAPPTKLLLELGPDGAVPPLKASRPSTHLPLRRLATGSPVKSHGPILDPYGSPYARGLTQAQYGMSPKFGSHGRMNGTLGLTDGMFPEKISQAQYPDIQMNGITVRGTSRTDYIEVVSGPPHPLDPLTVGSYPSRRGIPTGKSTVL